MLYLSKIPAALPKGLKDASHDVLFHVKHNAVVFLSRPHIHHPAAANTHYGTIYVAEYSPQQIHCLIS